MSKKLTLTEEWDMINQRIDAASQEFIDSYYLVKERPTVLYCIYSYKTIIEQKVKGFSIYIQGRPCLFTKRPTRKLVDELWNWSLAFNPTIEDIRVHYEYSYLDGGGVSGAHKLADIDGKRVSENRDNLVPLLEELINKYRPREGHGACAYCRRQVPVEGMIEYTVIARQYPGMKKTSKYCSKTCGVNDQMAHEG